MDSSGLGGRFLLNAGLLDLQSSVPRYQQNQLTHLSLIHQYQKNMMHGLENDQHHIRLMEVKGSGTKTFAMNFSKGRAVSPINATNNGYTSEEDEPKFIEDGNGEYSNNGRRDKKGSMWQRMKWTDNVVRLLITVVACVGDDGMHDGAEGGLKRKSGILQKKGKWKTVSKIMISKGCQVSPQQCEDKFNDLNKRYKRLNDIFGRGVTCQVVENPALMDSMQQLSAKAKDDVRKILCSKHLFYKEMFAFHNGKKIPNCHDVDLQGYSLPSGRGSNDNNESEEEEAERNNDTEDDESDNEDDHNDDGYGERMVELGKEKEESKEDGQFWSQSSGRDSFEIEMARVFQDPLKSFWERREWIKKQKLLLQDQRVNIQAQAFELEKQHLKWKRYCSKKDHELERSMLENERIRLDNERMILHLRQKEFEIDVRRAEASLELNSLGNRVQDSDHIDLGRH